MRTASIAIAFVLVACGEAAAPPAPPPSAPPIAAPTPTPPTAPRAHQALTPEQRAMMTTAFRDGRRLAHELRWSEAAARFATALILAPGDAHVRCETGYAQYRAGNLDAAAAQMRRVLAQLPNETPEAERIPTAQCLYNVGLVAEARDDRAAAREAYSRSLALRPNETVATHLAAVSDAPPSPPPMVRDWIALADGADDAVVLAAMRAHYCTGWAAFGTPCPAELQHRVLASATSPELSATIDFVGGAASYESDFGNDYLVIRNGSAVRFALLSDFGADGCNVAFEHLALADLVAGGAPELSFDITQGCVGNGSEPCETRDGLLQVCTVDGGLRCARVTTHSEMSCWVRDLGQFEDDEELEDAESEAGDDAYAYDAVVTFAGAWMTVTNGAGDHAFPPEEPIASLVGTRPVAELFSVPALAWPAAP
jgi:tetratricopeptide (TPR) repeat protein